MNIKEDNIKYSKLKSQIIKAATLKECFFKNSDDCKGNIINAHSLQRLGALSIIEGDVNGNKKVYALTEREINPETGEIELIPIGKKDASTFLGFCGYHDTIFSPLEQNPEEINLDLDDHCFLLSFRAFAISYHRKKEQIHLLSQKEGPLKEPLEEYFGGTNLSLMLEGSELGLKDMEPQKKTLTDALIDEDYSCLEFLTYEFNYTAPIAMSMATSPPFLFSGKTINLSHNPKDSFSDILTSVIPMKNRTIVVLAAFKEDPWGIEYLDELYEMKGQAFEKALTWHIITNAENCFFSPKWYTSLLPKEKVFIIQLSDFSADFNSPVLKYESKNFSLNLFEKKYSINN